MCTGIESITLHENVKTITQNAFYGCKNVKKITCQSVTPPACGAKALEGISRTECTLYVPAESTAYPTTSPWSEFTNIVGGKTDTPDTPETCKAPTISIVNGKLHIESSTYGSKCSYSITSEDIKSGEVEKNTLVSLSGEYTITAYATAEGMYNSEKVTKTLYLSNPSFDGKVEAKTDTVYKEVVKEVIKEVTVEVHDTIYIYDDSKSDIKLPDGHECTLYVRNGKIMITDAPIGTILVVYNIVGTKEKELTVTDFITEIDLPRNNIYIVNIAGKVFKVKI